jgi:hypothetical protein
VVEEFAEEAVIIAMGEEELSALSRIGWKLRSLMGLIRQGRRIAIGWHCVRA